MSCSKRESYLDRSLSPVQLAAFEEHLQGCATCTPEVRSWQTASDLLAEWGEDRVGPTYRSDGSQRQADMILARHRERRGQRRRAVVSLGLAAAASFFLALLLVGSPEPSQVALETEVIYREGASSELKEDVLAVFGRGRLVARLGDDRIGLGDEASVRILGASAGETQLRLERGSLGVDAARRGESERLLVQAGQYRVMVVGTRFRVRHPENGGFQVAVDEGTVEVSGPGQRWWLDAGKSLEADSAGMLVVRERSSSDVELRRLLSPMSIPQLGTAESLAPTDGAETSPPAMVAEPSDSTAPLPAPAPAALPKVPAVRPVAPPPVAGPDLASLRAQLARGGANEVIAVLEEHLEKAPQSGKAWRLLATARRKAGDLPGAVSAYRQVVEFGSAAEAARARYEAARLLQGLPGGHDEALALFEALLATPAALPGLQPEIRLHLSRSLRATGRGAEAEAMLQELIARWPATAAAEVARGELSPETH